MDSFRHLRLPVTQTLGAENRKFAGGRGHVGDEERRRYESISICTVTLYLSVTQTFVAERRKFAREGAARKQWEDRRTGKIKFGSSPYLPGGPFFQSDTRYHNASTAKQKACIRITDSRFFLVIQEQRTGRRRSRGSGDSERFSRHSSYYNPNS